MATPNRKVKAHIARKVVRAVKAKNGRFLKRAPGRPAEDDVFVVADEEVILEKAKQALRHGKCTTKAHAPSLSSTSSFTSTASSVRQNTSCHNNSSWLISPPHPSVASLPLASSNLAQHQQESDPLVALAIFAARNQRSDAVSSPPPATIPALPSSSSTMDDIVQSMSPATYKVALQLLITMAEQKRNEDSSDECLEILNVVELLIQAKRRVSDVPATVQALPSGTIAAMAPSLFDNHRIVSNHPPCSPFAATVPLPSLPFPSSSPTTTSSAKSLFSFDNTTYSIMDAVSRSQYIPKAA
jgi:hypothetical protein